MQWPKLISTLIERIDKNKYCRFHQDHEHRTNECRNLKDQVETLIQQRKLQKYIKMMELHRYQGKDDQDRTSEVRDNKPPAGEIKRILGGLNGRWNVEVPEKSTGERIK